ncbi:MAG: acyltransferase family protein, partial [Pseudolabrys sp.]
GYVITRLISGAIAVNSFSFPGFYISRAIRLMPALMVTIILTILGSRYLLGTNDYQAAAWSGLAAALSVSNIWFWLDAGYFSESSAFTPLLPTGSLGVEEQFYLFWPMIYFYVIRNLANQKIVVFSIAFTGAMISLLVSQSSADTTFYLSPFRFYQFMLGAGFATMARDPRFAGTFPTHGRFLTLVPVAALAAMALMTYNSGPQQIFVQFLISLLAAGSCFAFEAMERANQTSFLSTRLAVAIGSGSYAIYLAHWPLVVGSKAIWGEQLSLGIKMPLFGASILAGILLSALVERPIRLRGRSDPRHGLKGFVTAALVLACLWVGWSSTSLSSNIASAGPVDLKAMHRDFDAAFNTTRCALVVSRDLTRGEVAHCLVEGDRNIIVIGDSFVPAVAVAMHLGTHANVVVLSRPGCPPYFGNRQKTLKALNRLEACRNAGEGAWPRLLHIIETLHHVDGLLVVGNWAAKEFSLDALQDSVDCLERTHLTVGLVGVTPIFSTSVPRLHETGKISPASGSLSSFVESDVDPHGRDHFLRDAVHGTVKYIEVIDTVCGQTCDAYNGGKIMYFDRDHMSLEGVRYLLSHGIYDAIIEAVEQKRPTTASSE